MADLIIGWGLVALAVLFVLMAGLCRAAAKPRPRPADAARTAAIPQQPSVRAPFRKAAGPALRVHLCVECHTHGVPRPGEICVPCIYRPSPVVRAEEILREAAAKGGVA